MMAYPHMNEGVDGKQYVMDPEGGMYTPDEADKIGLEYIRVAAEVRRANE